MWDEEWERSLKEAAIERVKQKVNPRIYQVFDAHILQGWPAWEVLRTFEISRGYLSVIEHRIAKLMRKEIDHLRTGRL
jgi:hypothetical protein